MAVTIALTALVIVTGVAVISGSGTGILPIEDFRSINYSTSNGIFDSSINKRNTKIMTTTY